MTGRVKWYRNSKGYGFITGEDGKEYFLHCSNIKCSKENLCDGYLVEFTPVKNDRGYIALDVNLVSV